jgi:hypothetical protein
MASGAGVIQRPDERRVREEIPRQLGKLDVIGVQAGHDFVADLPDRSIVVAEKTRLHLFLARLPVLRSPPHQRDVAADVLAQQLLRFEQVVLVILLEDADARWLGQRAEVNGRGIDGGRNVHEAQIEAAARQLQLAHVPHQGDVGVVNRDGQIDLVVERGRALIGGAVTGVRNRRRGPGTEDACRNQQRRKPDS